MGGGYSDLLYVIDDTRDFFLMNVLHEFGVILSKKIYTCTVKLFQASFFVMGSWNKYSFLRSIKSLLDENITVCPCQQITWYRKNRLSIVTEILSKVTTHK